MARISGVVLACVVCSVTVACSRTPLSMEEEFRLLSDFGSDGANLGGANGYGNVDGVAAAVGMVEPTRRPVGGTPVPGGGATAAMSGMGLPQFGEITGPNVVVSAGGGPVSAAGSAPGVSFVPDPPEEPFLAPQPDTESCTDTAPAALTDVALLSQGFQSVYFFGDGVSTSCPGSTPNGGVCMYGVTAEAMSDYSNWGVGIGFQMSGADSAGEPLPFDAAALGIVAVSYDLDFADVGGLVRTMFTMANDFELDPADFEQSPFVWSGGASADASISGHYTVPFYEFFQPEWSTLMGEGPLDEGIDTPLHIDRLHSLQFQMVSVQSREQPYAFCVDNIQWLDATGSEVMLPPFAPSQPVMDPPEPSYEEYEQVPVREVRATELLAAGTLGFSVAWGDALGFFAVGATPQEAVVLSIVDDEFELQPLPEFISPNAIWAASAAEIYISTDTGILTNTSGSWQQQTVPAEALPILDIVGLDDGRRFAASAQGVLQWVPGPKPTIAGHWQVQVGSPAPARELASWGNAAGLLAGTLANDAENRATYRELSEDQWVNLEVGVLPLGRGLVMGDGGAAALIESTLLERNGSTQLLSDTGRTLSAIELAADGSVLVGVDKASLFYRYPIGGWEYWTFGEPEVSTAFDQLIALWSTPEFVYLVNQQTVSRVPRPQESELPAWAGIQHPRYTPNQTLR